jgi:thioredoxin-related protein
MGKEELVSKFGLVLAVPTLIVFGPDGKTLAALNRCHLYK